MCKKPFGPNENIIYELRGHFNTLTEYSPFIWSVFVTYSITLYSLFKFINTSCSVSCKFDVMLVFRIYRLFLLN